MSYKAYTITTANPDLPVPLDGVKRHLRMDDLSQEDETIQAMVMAATSNIEKQYGLCLLTQTVTEYWSAFPCSTDEPMMLRIQPVQSITSVQYLDTDGLTQTWDSDEWVFGGYNGTTFITPLPDFSWPSTWATPNAVIITYEAGYGDSPDNVPPAIAQAIKFMVADMFERREDTPQTLVRASENLLRPYYRWTA